MFVTIVAVVVNNDDDDDDDDGGVLPSTLPEAATPLLTLSLLSSVSSTDTDRGEEDGRRDCPAAAGSCSACITGWMARHTA